MKYYFMLLSILVVTSTSAQISICPKIGINYYPASRLIGYGSNSNNLRLTYGISALMPLSSKSFLESKLSYIKRNNIEWNNYGVAYDVTGFINHSDFNVDFTYHMKFKDPLSIGIGPSFVKKINSTLENGNYDNSGQIRISDFNKFEYGVNLNVKFNFSYFSIDLEYMRKVSPEFRYFSDRNRFSILLGVPIKL